MMDDRAVPRLSAVAFAIALVSGLSGCGGGGSNVRPSNPAPPPGNGSGGTADQDVTYDSSKSATWSDNISGTGGLIKDGTGTLVLVGTNTYTGGTTINQGTLQIGDGGAVGSIVGDVKDSGNLVFNRSDDVIFSGEVSGPGSLEQAGTGRLILTGNNTYTGGTTISRGTLQLGNGGTTGWIVGDVTDNGALVFDRSDDVIFGGEVSGTGSLEQAGTGRLTLTGNNTYAGGTTISRGTLQLGNGGTTGWIVGDVTDNGTLVFDRGDQVTFAGAITGTGALVQSGAGTLILTGENSYKGGTTITLGTTLQIGNGGNSGSITGNVIDNGSLVFNRRSDPTFYGVVGGAISGSGSLTQAGSDTLILTGANTYTGGTTINSGTLQIGNYGTTGSIVGDVVDKGSLVFAPGGKLRFDGIVSGDGTLTKTGDGTLVLTGASTYSGGTTVAGGTLEIARGASLGPGRIAVGSYGPYFFDDHILKVDSGVTLFNVIELGGFGTLDNAGDIGGTRDNALAAPGPRVTVLNHDGGHIHGTESALVTDDLGTVDNGTGGIIEGGSLALSFGRGGVVSNDGAGSIIRSPGGTAIRVLGETGKVENTGGATITSGSTAIYLEHGGKVTNGRGSTIESTGATAGDCGASTPCAIFVASGASTDSTADGGLDVSNAGIIIGDVQMIPTAYNSATLSAGSSIQGNLAMGTNQGSFLTLDGGAGTVQRYSDAVTGTTTFGGLLIKKGGGSWVIDGDDLDHVATARVEAGTLQIGDGGTLGQVGSATSGSYGPVDIQIYSGGKLVFNRSDDVVYWGYLAGPGADGGASLVQKGTGDLTFPDLRVIDFLDVVVEQGSVTLGDGSFQNDYLRPVSVTNHGTLTFDNDGQVYLESVISGSGSLIKRGPGMLSLDEANTYTGGTTVAEGTLRAMEVLPGNVTVNAGAVLQGATYNGAPPGLPGTVGDLSNGGRVAVGRGNARIGGSYVNAATGTLAVSLGSKLDVAGTATLDGGTLEITGADSSYVASSRTDVLTAAGGVSGTFDQLVKDAGVVFTATTINYDANSVWLDTTGLDVTTAAAGAGVSYTPVSMGSAVRVQSTFTQLDDRFATGSLSDVSMDFLDSAGEFQQAPSLLAAQASLRSLSGELHAISAAMTFKAIDAADRVLSDRLDALLERGAGAGMWTHDLSIGGDMARAGYGAVDFQVNGWLVGSDRTIGRSGIAGFALGQSRGQQRLDRSFDHEDSLGTEAMVYSGWLDGNRYVLGRVGFGRFQQDVSRQVLLGYRTHGVSTRYNGSYGVAYGESGLHLGQARGYVVPFISVQYARVDRGSFAEQGAGGFGLRAHAQTLDRWQAGLGVRAGRRWDFSGSRALDFSAHAQWQRTLASHGDVFDASFVGLEQWQPLVGIGLSRYSGVLGFNLDAALSSRTTLQFGYDYEVGQRHSAQAWSTRLNVAF
ncbi:autotransporter-associated beta strand repeat-containing protein [Frateuria soli]|uniref:autotransporter-associated beta strand repeat-containing protein n=1 Tax=Frateuria soli TaxID=1542730 RepID=UPI001E572B92|nr:autotransporter-associated beta strand repeat-containing protein [Frateuria soli]UGB37193.1 autotransporter-associated beta strand repeat-containing protein [Frateuria soli]